MGAKRKITYTFYTDNSNVDVNQLVSSRKIRMVALAAGETMAEWARALGFSRQFVHQVVTGKRNNKRVRDFIENRLGMKFWNDNEK